MSGANESGSRNELSGSTSSSVQAQTINGPVHIGSYLSVQDLPSPRQLPPDIPHFIDREETLRRLDLKLSVGVRSADQPVTVVISAIAGAGGIGKTAVAVHWAHRVRHQFPDGDLYLDFQAYGKGPAISADEALDAFLRALNVPTERIPQTTHERAALFRTICSGRRLLLLLDNVGSAEQVRPLMPASTTCVVVVTSRNTLRGLGVREGASRMQLDALAPDAAARLLAEIIGAERVEAEHAAAAEIAAYCSFLPLPLRVVAERVLDRPGTSLTEISHELSVERERLDLLSRSEDDLAAVRTVFMWSYQNLRIEERIFFAYLGLHPGVEMSVDACVVLSGVERGRVVLLLDSLTSSNLIQERDTKRHRMHDLVRLFAAERAEADLTLERRRNALRNIYLWYLTRSWAAYRIIVPQGWTFPIDESVDLPGARSFRDLPDALAWCETERVNLVDSVRQSKRFGLVRVCWQLAVSASAFLERGSYLENWVQVSQIGIDAARDDADMTARTHLILLLADAHRHRRDFELALERYSEGYELSLQNGDRWRAAFAVRGRAMVLQEKGEFQQVLDAAERARELFEQIGESRGRGLALLSIAGAYNGLRDYQRAGEYCQEALAIFEEIDNRWSIAAARLELGRSNVGQGAPDQARAQFDAAADLYGGLGDRQARAEALAESGRLALSVGDVEQARTTFTEARALFEAMGDPRAASVDAQVKSLSPEQ
ncbi:ATP-binding protein [Cryptosporangium arvum]|uniref:ATP-dependent transcriptional regulator n=1 Tax=Cryptosporangium arvum DSM 44712 TaxID=927661 RepID=A0A011AH02_9ACTN|nr:tetratricopeptide repeat protein [Cryptosporangium arvum]EXG81266.1 ATP-dependent transcriptional regulator [Cryptosporangium arvum DSM 44712]